MTLNPRLLSDERRLFGLPSPVKNNFFYGMLLTDDVFRKEQQYGDDKRWLLNRLSLGQGVLSGLDFELGLHDAEPKSYIRLMPGVAVDGLGREIVVSEHTMNEHPINLVGDGVEIEAKESNAKEFIDKIDATKQGRYVLLQLAYHSDQIDQTPVKAGNCSHECEPAKTKENYQVRVIPLDEVFAQMANKSDFEELLPLHDKIATVKKEIKKGNYTKQELQALQDELNKLEEQFHTAYLHEPNRENADQWKNNLGLKVFPLEPGEDVRHRDLAQLQRYLVEETLDNLVDDNVDDQKTREKLSWIPLGIIKVKYEDQKLTFSKVKRFYRQLYSNNNLSKLLFSLADRVDEASRIRVLTLADDSGEGQSAPVYQALDKPLRLRVIDSHGNAPKNYDSVRVSLTIQSQDGGKLALGAKAAPPDGVDPNAEYWETPFNKLKEYKDDGVPVQSTIDVNINAKGMAEPVYWRFHKTPGPHTVIARIIPNDPTDPPFHPGSQVTLHATAVNTAPTIIGMELHDWYCKKSWKTGAKLRIIFSRKMSDATFHDHPWLRVWRMHAEGCHDNPDKAHGPESIKADFCGDLHSLGHTHDPHGPWYAEFKLSDLVKHMEDYSTLRLLVAVRTNTGDHPVSEAINDPDAHPQGKVYPVAQVLDADFEGSFVTLKDRNHLWDHNTFLHGNAHHHWARMQPREACLPSGNGAEGGEFHKAFEFRIPHC